MPVHARHPGLALRMRSSLFAGLVACLACGPSGEGKGGPGGGKGGGRGGHGGPPGAGGAKDPGEPLAVELAAVERRDIVRGYMASGTLEAIQSIEVRPTQSGVLAKTYVEEGDRVDADQMLARVDVKELSLAAKRDKVAAANARRELDRLDELVAQQAASTQEIDQQRYAVAAAEASARLSRYQVSLGTVRAPFAGTITARLLDPGNYVTAADVVYELADLSVLELSVHVPEREAARVAIGAPVVLGNLADAEFRGEVVRRAPVVDPLTGTVKFTVHTGEERPETAVPGAFVRAFIELEAHRQVPALPQKAIVRNPDANFVYVIEDGKAMRKPVELGLEDVEWVEISGGLAPGDRVVADVHEITDGMPLKPFVAGAAHAEGEPEHRKERKPEAG